VGTLDEVREDFGPDFFHPSADRQPTHNWHELCVCGHLDRYHSESTGGRYHIAPTSVKTMGGVEWTVGERFIGCVGALKSRGFEEKTADVDREAHTNFLVTNPTCPCTEFRPVAKVDRPNRFFNQRIPKDRDDRDRHPFMVGIRAFNTFLSGRSAAKKDPKWADREFDRRFQWIGDRRVCSISMCRVNAGVWPVFVDGERSELRCGAHRPTT
jgi:hypothetical protein